MGGRAVLGHAPCHADPPTVAAEELPVGQPRGFGGRLDPPVGLRFRQPEHVHLTTNVHRPDSVQSLYGGGGDGHHGALGFDVGLGANHGDTAAAVVPTLYVAPGQSSCLAGPRTALNQVEGGISQMLGIALSDELMTDAPTGVTLNGSYLEHKGPIIQDCPNITTIFADVVDPVGPMGAKVLGEVPSVGVAPVIANALYDAIGFASPACPSRWIGFSMRWGGGEHINNAKIQRRDALGDRHGT